MKILFNFLTILSIGISINIYAQQSATLTSDEMNDKGSEYYQSKNYTEALKWFSLSAKQGNMVGQHNVGVMYRDGLGVTKDLNEAVKWFRLAAEQGKASSQQNLGMIYRFGKDIKKDDVEAFKWFKLAAEQGVAVCQLNVGLMYQNGEGVLVDKAEAAKWLRLAAEQGNGDAQISLGLLYYKGDGVSKDSVQAIKWIRASAATGNKEGQYNMGILYRDGLWVSQNFKEAIKWFRLSAEQGKAYSQNALGWMIHKGQGSFRDDVEAIKWFRLAADQGLADSQYNLGALYLTGDKTIRNYDEAIKWFNLAAQSGNEKAKKFSEYIKKLNAFSERVNLDSFLAETCNCLQEVLLSSTDKIGFSIGTQNCYGELYRKLINAEKKAFDLSELKGILTFGLSQKCDNWNNFYDKERKYMNEKEESKIKNQKECRVLRDGIFTQAENFDEIEVTMKDSLQLVTFKSTGYFTKSRVEWLDDCSYKLHFVDSSNPYEKASHDTGSERIIRIIEVINNDTVIYQAEDHGVYNIGTLTKKQTASRKK